MDRPVPIHPDNDDRLCFPTIPPPQTSGRGKKIPRATLTAKPSGRATDNPRHARAAFPNPLPVLP